MDKIIQIVEDILLVAQKVSTNMQESLDHRVPYPNQNEVEGILVPFQKHIVPVCLKIIDIYERTKKIDRAGFYNLVFMFNSFEANPLVAHWQNRNIPSTEKAMEMLLNWEKPPESEIAAVASLPRNDKLEEK